MNGAQLRLALSIVVMTLLTPLFLQIFLTKLEVEETSTAQQNLQHATMAAVQRAFEHSDNESINIYDSKEAREKAVETFFEVFTKSIGATTKNDSYFYARYLVPVVAMVDNDGYYLMYSKTVNAGQGDEYQDVITPINTWNEQIGNFIVRYYLIDSYVVVTDTGSNQEYKGIPADVYEKMGQDYTVSYIASTLNYLNDAAEFKQRKNDIILSTLQSQINYMINTHNTFYNKYDVNYSFVMPQLKGDFQDVLEGPTFLAFEQGNQIVDTSREVSNIYALASADLVGYKFYYIVNEGGDKYYHDANCSHLTEEQKQNAFIGSAKFCALHGAYPDRDCIK